MRNSQSDSPLYLTLFFLHLLLPLGHLCRFCMPTVLTSRVEWQSGHSTQPLESTRFLWLDKVGFEYVSKFKKCQILTLSPINEVYTGFLRMPQVWRRWVYSMWHDQLFSIQVHSTTVVSHLYVHSKYLKPSKLNYKWSSKKKLVADFWDGLTLGAEFNMWHPLGNDIEFFFIKMFVSYRQATLFQFTWHYFHWFYICLTLHSLWDRWHFIEPCI
jgi:hypothetical protein